MQREGLLKGNDTDAPPQTNPTSIHQCFPCLMFVCITCLKMQLLVQIHTRSASRVINKHVNIYTVSQREKGCFIIHISIIILTTSLLLLVSRAFLLHINNRVISGHVISTLDLVA